ncbi:MAG: hypothetical protein M3N03_07875 [Actinomycetota bacterium]|jgi:hypothetical protein|nr:hypothetical protein [Actinomycetota bacterium]
MTLDLTADLYEACLQISPRHSDYATLSIEDGFDWSSLSRCLFERLYLVVFRSVWQPEADLDLLREYDDRAFEEALVSGGLLRYFKGHANELGECLSFCLWETREQAREAAGAPSHRSAAGVSAQMYLSYSLDRYWIEKVREKLVFEPMQM